MSDNHIHKHILSHSKQTSWECAKWLRRLIKNCGRTHAHIRKQKIVTKREKCVYGLWITQEMFEIKVERKKHGGNCDGWWKLSICAFKRAGAYRSPFYFCSRFFWQTFQLLITLACYCFSAKIRGLTVEILSVSTNANDLLFLTVHSAERTDKYPKSIWIDGRTNKDVKFSAKKVEEKKNIF